MKSLFIDIETYCDKELSKVGVYRYAEDPTFQLLLIAYAIDGKRPAIIDCKHGERLPLSVENALQDDSVIKVAHNANFERVCLSGGLTSFLDPKPWRCTMVHAASLGLPKSLAYLARYLGLKEQKDKDGMRLINLFSKPKNFKPKADDWQKFKDYCLQDVRTLIKIKGELDKSPMPKSEWELYALDQEINDRGIRVDLPLAGAAVEIDEVYTKELIAELKKITGLSNPNSTPQMSRWVKEHGGELPNLLRTTCVDAIKIMPKGKVSDALKLRIALSKSSTKKYQALLRAACSDDRVRGMFQFAGASTGRWAGRLVQMQNLPRGSLNDNKVLRVKQAVIEKNPKTAPYLKDIIRSSFIPKTGCEFIVSDFSSIEARVLAWLAAEEWAIAAFARGEDIYKSAAARMWGINIEDVTSEQRAKGKMATLALGYQGAVGALTRIGGGTEEGYEMISLVKAWRKANRYIVSFWATIERAAKTCVVSSQPISIRIGTNKCMTVTGSKGLLVLRLPSGRPLTYQKAMLKDNTLVYDGSGTHALFETQDSYGGKLTENVVQAIARDLLAETMKNLDLLGYKIVAHIHDEIIIEAKKGEVSTEEISEIMGIIPAWAAGLSIKAETFRADFYKKG
jgi:DNA polymerase